MDKEEIKSLDARLASPEGSDIKKCPYCAEEIKVEAIKCKHCGSDIGNKFLDDIEAAFEQKGDKAYRKCLACGYKGKMKTWLKNYGLPQLIALVLLFAYIIPGIIFIAWGWGKYKCPKCGALAKNIQA